MRLTRDLSDFEVYRTAGARVIGAEALYREADGHQQFKYFPLFAVLMAPTALVSAEVAKAVWFGGSFALLVLLVVRSVRLVPRDSPAPTWLLAATALILLRFAIRELSLGQSNAALAVVLLATIRRPIGPMWAGALVGLATFIKPYALLVLPWLAADLGLGAVVGTAGVVVAGLAAPAALYGWTGNLTLLAHWYDTVTTTTAPNLLQPENVSLASAWAKWLGAGVPATGLAALTIAGLAGAFALVWQRRAAVPEPRLLEFALLMLLVPLLSPQGWDYVLLVGAPAIALVLDRWPRLPTPARTAAALALVAVAVPVRELMGLHAANLVGELGLVTLAALLLVAVLVSMRVRRLA